MATSTLAKSLSSNPESERPYDGQLIDELVRTVEKAEKPKPPQPVSPASDEDREKNAACLHELWALGESLVPNSLKIALNGYPDVNTYYAEREGM